MKKVLTHIMAVVALISMLFTASCTKVENPGALGVESEVTFSISAPDFITRAYGDGSTAKNLTVAVYDGNNNYLENASTTETLENKAATVTLSLVKGKAYKIVFWAYKKSEGVYTSPYTFNTETAKLTVDYTGVTANNENLDAFYFVKEYTAYGAKTEQIKIKLTRPFAQLNVAAAESTVTQTGVTVSRVYSEMNMITGKVSKPVDVTFQEADTPAKASQILVGYENYQWLSMNYLLVEDDQMVVDVTLTTKSNEVTSGTCYSSVPVQRNYRTNIVINNEVETNKTIERIID